ncbi:MAG: HU family DNA-binding protein, partial [Pseudomonadota bacterium]
IAFSESYLMTRAELIEQLAMRQSALMLKDVELSVRLILDELFSALCKGNRVEIKGFGSFGINHRSTRRRRNAKSDI